jgi:hypothetical protein
LLVYRGRLAVLAGRFIVEARYVVPAGDTMWFRAGADLVVVVHLLFIGFVVGGVFLAWR